MGFKMALHAGFDFDNSQKICKFKLQSSTDDLLMNIQTLGVFIVQLINYSCCIHNVGFAKDSS